MKDGHWLQWNQQCSLSFSARYSQLDVFEAHIVPIRAWKCLIYRVIQEMNTVFPHHVETLNARKRVLHCIGLWADRKKQARKGKNEKDSSFGSRGHVGY